MPGVGVVEFQIEIRVRSLLSSLTTCSIRDPAVHVVHIPGTYMCTYMYTYMVDVLVSSMYKYVCEGS